MTDNVNIPTITNGIPLYTSGDPRTAFKHNDADAIRRQFGPPRTLLSGSTKIEKCGSVGVLCRVLYMTPGLFCPASTQACRDGCLGHTSGHMHMVGPTRARDQRAAFYIQHNGLFIQQLKDEIAKLYHEAKRKGVQPAIRLNGTSDILWERKHADVFAEFPDVQFYDYTKVASRMPSFSQSASDWPSNYHLTFSGDGSRPEVSKRILRNGGSVAVVFWPELPGSWWGHTVIDGDEHDARFLDPRRVIVGLKAKGIARVDMQGFVVRPCPVCCQEAPELRMIDSTDDSHRTTIHRCDLCGYTKESRWVLPTVSKNANTPCSPNTPNMHDQQLQLRLAI